MKKLRWDPIAKEQITEIFNFYKTRYGLQYRSLIEGNYKIVYCLEKDKYIRIVAIFDCRQNPDKLSRNL